MFCCLSRETRADLTNRDLEVMRAFAGLSADQINTHIAMRLEEAELRNRLHQIIGKRDFDLVYQPIFASRDLAPCGIEALCRFRSMPYRPPNLWFEEAALAGLQIELEAAVIKAALPMLRILPAHMYLSVNACPETVASGRLREVFANVPGSRLLLEVTEHARVENYDSLLSALKELRDMGIRLAIDDAGAGYSGLQHIIRLQPDVIKLDMSLTRDIDTDVVRRSLAGALVRFAEEIDAKIVAEGVETKPEMTVLKDLGVALLQGYLLAKAMPAAELMASLASLRKSSA
ncbi:EAL domain-containing protein [Roseovarius aestuariivivens]|uniref:EAL domain-containing protein n=1 Tax=Roseovarius aestuariivivens TaxID=1888910 RepID=UPI00108218A2|nr:EAL domain-containing protein [Roseovarius aestuariivivens]